MGALTFQAARGTRAWHSLWHRGTLCVAAFHRRAALKNCDSIRPNKLIQLASAHELDQNRLFSRLAGQKWLAEPFLCSFRGWQCRYTNQNGKLEKPESRPGSRLWAGASFRFE